MSGVPTGYVKDGAPRLKLHRERKHGMDKLPFVAGERDTTLTPCWQVPAVGGAIGGYETGEALALSYLKCLRGEQQGRLVAIISSMMAQYDQVDGPAMSALPAYQWSEEFASFRGQMMGFFGMLDLWLHTSAVQCGVGLARVSEQDLLKRANAGLAFDSEAYLSVFS
ncbi:hypothetical protein GWC92_04595 [Aeromonas caviae]|uniref:hypothetical protein n=1 Tax=Aeromonas caviae TaxID=648 RepID=UPI0015DE936E|nr:hypothetical protein [Aeromonas caviae]QLL79663.1 hypothetical protein GWC92_04595 [Aeromonas caviae]